MFKNKRHAFDLWRSADLGSDLRAQDKSADIRRASPGEDAAVYSPTPEEEGHSVSALETFRRNTRLRGQDIKETLTC